MAHFPKPFFKKARKLWYVEINRKQINLGPDRDQAFRKYHEIMSQPRLVTSSKSLVYLVDVYLDWVQKNRAADTYEWYRYRLQRFIDKYPTMNVDELRPYHVEQWVDAYDIAVTTRRNYFRSIKTCLRWAQKQGYINSNPIASMEIPGAEAKDVYVSPTEFDNLLDFVPDLAFRDLLTVTYHTGCRPQESLAVRDEHVDLENSRWVFPQKEAKGKKAPRIVYLDRTALQITQRLLSKCNGATLFRNSFGRSWTTDAVNCSFDRIRTRMGKAILKSQDIEPSNFDVTEKIKSLNPTKLIKGVQVSKTASELRCEAKTKLIRKLASNVAPRYCLYSLRHSWATNSLRRGVDPLTVAILMGHKDPSTLARVYQHLAHSPEHMLEQAMKATRR